MKLLDHFYDEEKANNLAWELRKHGVLTHVSSRRSHQLSSAKTGALRVGLWIVMDKQFNDAKKFIKDRNHVIGFKLSEEEMAALEKEAEDALSKEMSIFINKSANWIAGIILFAIIGLIAYRVVNAL